MSVVVVNDLHKRYGQVRAVDGLSFTVEDGEVFALVGPNGAGKTTTLEILEGYRHPTSGTVSVLGYDPQTGGRAFRERIGIVLQDAGLDEAFTVAELVALYGGPYPRRRPVGEVIELVGLSGKQDARVKTLSGGQRRRLDLAIGLVGDPDLLFLDEPTTGFDPSARRRAWALVERLRSLGKTILLTTHYMDEAQHLADRVAIIDAGRLVAIGPPETLTGGGPARALIGFRLPAGTGLPDLPRLRGTVTGAGALVEVETAQPVEDLHALTGWALARGCPLPALTITRPTLEAVYLDLTEQAGPSAAGIEPAEARDG